MATGKKIKELIEERKTNTNAVANEAGIPARSLYNIIKRDSDRIDINTIIKIAKVLHVPVEYFSPVNYTQTSNQQENVVVLSKKEFEMLTLVRNNFSIEKQEALVNIIQIMVDYDLKGNGSRPRPGKLKAGGSSRVYKSQGAG